MSPAERARADVRLLRDRLKAEGRNHDAEVIQRVVRSFEATSGTLKQVSADLRACVAKYGWPE